MEMTKEILIEYCEMKQEAADLRIRIERDRNKLCKMQEKGYVVSDTVRGSRKDGTIGTIKITGFPYPAYEETKAMLKKRIAKLEILESDLLEAINKVDDYIATIPKSKLRMIFRLYYLDDLTWSQVAIRMNERFPGKRIKYTEDSCRKQHDRYLEKRK